jgi:hypothetical protein
MMKLLIGPALLGAGYLAGSVYGRDAEQLVHRSPADTYAAVEAALENVRPNGTTFFDGGTPMPYEVKVAHPADRKLLVTLSFGDQEGATAELDFLPKDDGKSTLIVTRMHGDHSVLRTALAGTDKAKLAYAPDWMLNLAARPLLQQVASQIEQGELTAFNGMSEGDAEAQWESNLSAEQREQVSEYRQYEATRPAVDPNTDAQNYTSGESR